MAGYTGFASTTAQRAQYSRPQLPPVVLRIGSGKAAGNPVRIRQSLLIEKTPGFWPWALRIIKKNNPPNKIIISKIVTAALVHKLPASLAFLYTIESLL